MQTKHSRWLSLAAALTVAALCVYWWPQSEQLAPEAEPTASPPRPRAPSPTSPTASRAPAPFTEPTAAEIERLDAGCLVVEVQRLDFCGPRADEDCDPRAAGVQLQLLNLEHPFTREGVTNAEGHWVVPDVPAGRYIVHSSELWVSAVEFRHDETRITRVVVMAALKAKVTVVVQREDGTPVPGADVGLLVNDQSTNQWGVTDDQGVFAPEASPADSGSHGSH